ncbi:MAG: DUF6825 family protein [cyanobacterium endosymbiont of Rhopalodia musculus]|uniref:DUF6825 family protein n=1 Tax=cyanobacterium endosymbiont of Epithemia clementina EcSB TaxID=3034674 RepID=UPI0024806215|nr:hypothetical protein [cyanobacterium endosymbiont of Epithemia clementina EcSB]WGT67732.1 hypothetical protein P3F56_01090 [cyanobacterium endosymbiont of Epithemia clementina EcSB]
MSNPILHAFFLGRAFAEVLSEKIEENFTNALGELSKFDAEQREQLRQFIEQVQVRAQVDVAQEDTVNTTPSEDSPIDLQETIDNLRAEIARLKAELKIYRAQKT